MTERLRYEITEKKIATKVMLLNTAEVAKYQASHPAAACVATPAPISIPKVKP